MTPARALAFGLTLTATAGFTDAVGFIALGGYYTSFMSGNTTRLGTGIALGGTDLALPAGLVILFFVGSYLGSLAAEASGWRGPAAAFALVVLGIVASLLLTLVGDAPAQALLPLAATSGAQNAALPPIGAARLGATFVTGTLFAAGQDLARATTGKAPRWRWLQHLAVWASLCVGALIGALAYSRSGMLALLAPAALYVGCFIWAATRRTGAAN